MKSYLRRAYRSDRERLAELGDERLRGFIREEIAAYVLAERLDARTVAANDGLQDAIKRVELGAADLHARYHATDAHNCLHQGDQDGTVPGHSVPDRLTTVLEDGVRDFQCCAHSLQDGGALHDSSPSVVADASTVARSTAYNGGHPDGLGARVLSGQQTNGRPSGPLTTPHI